MTRILPIVFLALVCASCSSTGRVATDSLESAWEAKNAPLGYRKVDSKKSIVISRDFNGKGKDGRLTFFKFPGGDPNGREDQPGLVFINGADGRNFKTQGGSGVSVKGRGTHLERFLVKAPFERGLGVGRGASAYLDERWAILGNEETVHLISVLDEGKAFIGRKGPGTAANGQSVVRPGNVTHGVKGPDDNPRSTPADTFTEWYTDNVALGVPVIHKGDFPSNRFKEVVR